MSNPYIKSRTVYVNKKDIFFDIDILSLYYSETGAASENVERDNNLSAETATPSGRRIITRMTDSRAANIRDTLRKFCAPVTMTEAADDYFDEDYEFDISITTEAPDNIFQTIADLAHKYIVSGALADWYAQLGIQGNRESLQARADESLARIKELIYFRPYPES